MAKALKLPKTPGAVADALYKQRAARLAVEKQAEALKAGETALKAHLFKLLPKMEATSISGKIATVSLERHVVPNLKDFDKLIAYCIKKKSWDLLKRSVNTKAWRERNDAKVVVPGVEPFVDWKVHCSKAGR